MSNSIVPSVKSAPEERIGGKLPRSMAAGSPMCSVIFPDRGSISQAPSHPGIGPVLLCAVLVAIAANSAITAIRTAFIVPPDLRVGCDSGGQRTQEERRTSRTVQRPGLRLFLTPTMHHCRSLCPAWIIRFSLTLGTLRRGVKALGPTGERKLVQPSRHSP